MERHRAFAIFPILIRLIAYGIAWRTGLTKFELQVLLSSFNARDKFAHLSTR